ncbi:acyl carrier protein [Streptomyces achromogenes]|uniref:acyl carrier protein n=1 Tax=Streptomyces achromogenes TaxID=67255 RepID=UPI0036979CC9
MPSSAAVIERDLLQFLETVARESVRGPDDDLFAGGYLNSLGALELVAFLEGQYGIAVEVEDLDLDNFRSVTRIVDFVLAKRSAREPRESREQGDQGDGRDAPAHRSGAGAPAGAAAGSPGTAAAGPGGGGR